MASATVEKYEWKLAFKEETRFMCALTCCALYNVCSVHSGDTMSASRGYLEYIGGIYILSTSGDVQYIGGIS